MVTLNKRELDKLIKILGVYQVKMLWINSKIKLSKELLDYLVSIEK